MFTSCWVWASDPYAKRSELPTGRATFRVVASLSGLRSCSTVTLTYHTRSGNAPWCRAASLFTSCATSLLYMLLTLTFIIEPFPKLI